MLDAANSSSVTDGAGAVSTSPFFCATASSAAWTCRASLPYATLTEMLIRQTLLRNVQFLTFSEMKYELGMRTFARSNVSNSVERTLILRT